MIYLDHHATTPLDGRVLDVMMPYMTDKFGNASSMDHPYGHDASEAVELARDHVAKGIGANPDEIIFTGGATESDNMALAGVMNRYSEKGDHLITCTTEHRAVLDVALHLEKYGKKVTYLGVDKYGQINLSELESAITDRTVMISIMAANNEIGTVTSLEEIGRIARDHDVIFHTDAAQATGHIPLDVKKMNIHLMSISAHKMYGPKGVGALYMRGMRPRIRLEPLVHGGGQERNMRSGTLNVPAIVGFGEATKIATREMSGENERFKKWSCRMMRAFEDMGGLLNGHPEERLLHNINMRFPGIDGKAVINSVSREIAISAGSACTAQTVEPSHVLLALGLSEDEAHSSIRIGMGRFNTEDEIGRATETILDAVGRLNSIKE